MRPFKITFFSWGQEVPGSNPGAPTFHTRISNGLWNPTDTVEGLITVQLLTCFEIVSPWPTIAKQQPGGRALIPCRLLFL